MSTSSEKLRWCLLREHAVSRSSCRASTRRRPRVASSTGARVAVQAEVVVVDDGSTDGSRESLMRRRSSTTRGCASCASERNQGKGAALRTRLPAATGRFVIVQDADLEYDPGDYALLLGPLLDGQADVVYGSASQRRRPAPRPVLLALRRQPLLTLSRTAHQPEPHRHGDVLQGVPARRDPVARASRRTGFGVEPEITAKVARAATRASTRSASATTGARTTKARRSAGATGCGRCGAFFAIHGPATRSLRAG